MFSLKECVMMVESLAQNKVIGGMFGPVSQGFKAGSMQTILNLA